jgi:hypothetical protein
MDVGKGELINTAAVAARLAGGGVFGIATAGKPDDSGRRP